MQYRHEQRARGSKRRNRIRLHLKKMWRRNQPVHRLYSPRKPGPGAVSLLNHWEDQEYGVQADSYDYDER